MTVDLTPFARRFLVPAHGKVLVGLKPDAPAVSEGAPVRLGGLTELDLTVERIVRQDAQGTTLLLNTGMVPIHFTPWPPSDPGLGAWPA